ncbi:hypothetical protein B0O99DRAFT_672107 [Bisporella sp. PMI_857]|nr:hypothetical protein B0O99DRAFT_672107 [Bisporella sp. PMI_857]
MPLSGSIPHPAAASTTTSSSTTAEPPAIEPVFICTVCWQAQFAPASPKILGSSSRIVCLPCWKAVLDLSICWVCGECIVRGDEVVSLGWCFWHRACFGCLACGTPIKLPESKRDYKAGVSRGGNYMTTESHIGIELDTIPMCDTCEDETECKVLERGLETLSDLLQAKNLGSPSCPLKAKRRASAPEGNGSGQPINSSSSMESDRVERKVDKIYLSVIEPMNEHAPLAPSNTKPLPKWMSFLPSNVYALREQRSAQKRKVESNIGSEYRGHFSPEHSDASFTAFPAFDYSKLRHTPLSPGNETAPIETPKNRAGRSTTISFEPNPNREYSISRASKSHKRARSRARTSSDSTHLSGYEPQDVPPRQRTPYPDEEHRPKKRTNVSMGSASCPQSMRLGVSDPVTEANTGLRLPSIGSPFSSNVPFPSWIPKNLIIPPYHNPTDPGVSSSEYIDKYHPKGAAAKLQKYEPKIPEPILEKIKRQKVGKRNFGEVGEDKRRERNMNAEERRAGRVKQGNEEFGLDPRREDLNRELRQLFNEE